jgi:integrase
MPYVRMKGFQIFRDRHGKLRCYHRKSRAAVDLHKYPIGSAGFLAECARIAGLLTTADGSRPGTLGALILAYRSSPAFRDLALRTRRDYQRCFDYLHPIADTPLVRFDRPLIVRIRDKAAEKHQRRFANYVRAVLSILFTWGLERGYIENNPAQGVRDIRRPRGTPRANRPWSDTERYAVLEAASWALKVPIALAMFADLREGDALTIAPGAYNGHQLNFVTGKTDQRICWPVLSALKHILDGAPRHNAATLAANSHGQSWTDSGFRGSWRKLRIRLEQQGKIGPGLTIHGLRHTVATILREEGFDERTIAEVLGQKTDSMARHYSRDADLSRKMGAVAERLQQAENKRRSKVVKPAPKIVKP